MSRRIHRLPRRHAVNHNWIIRPSCADWLGLVARAPVGVLADRPLADWRRISREELGLTTDRPIIATGHQTFLWHPGILAKYLVTDAFAQAHDLATANLVVDQHVGEFGAFEIPIRKHDGSLGVRKVTLCECREDVPMGRHAAFAPPQPPDDASLSAAIPSVADGVRRIFAAVHAHRDAPNAALQMAAAIADLMGATPTAPEHGGHAHTLESVRMSQQGLAGRAPDVTATALINTSLARAIMRRMADDPRRCAECYNRAAIAVPEAGIGPLIIRDDYVELPVWRIGDDGRRMRGYDSDVERGLEMTSDELRVTSQTNNRHSSLATRHSNAVTTDELEQPNQDETRHSLLVTHHSLDLLPRALFMTALVRLGMCDLFIHGTGGAAYDRTMEIWIKEWLGIDVGSIAVVSATLRLPLSPDGEEKLAIDEQVWNARRLWHDPETDGSRLPKAIKKKMLEEIDRLPRNSPQRKAAFLAMHERLRQMRIERKSMIDEAQRRAERAKRQAADWKIAQRRDWAFALYPPEMLENLADEARQAVAAPADK